MSHVKTKSVGISIGLLLAIGCATVSDSDFAPVSAASNSPAQLRWTPQSEGKSLDIGVGIVNPSYETAMNFEALCKGCEGNIRQLGEETLTALPAALQKDIEKALLAKGLSVTGTFSDLKSMTYAQKEKSNLVLVPKIGFDVKFQVNGPSRVFWKHPMGSEEPELPFRIYRLKPGHEILLGGHRKFEQAGKVSVSGAVSLSIYEPLTGEKLWVKDLAFPAQGQPFAIYYWQEEITDKKGNVISVTNHPLAGYDTRVDALVKAFEAIYPELYTGFKTYFSKEEMTQVRIDADKVRKLKRY